MDAHTKAYEEKVRAELQQAKSQLEELEARSKVGISGWQLTLSGN